MTVIPLGGRPFWTVIHPQMGHVTDMQERIKHFGAIRTYVQAHEYGGRIGEAAVYTLEFDEQSRLLTQRASGFWDLEEFGRYQAEFTALVTRLRNDGRPFTMLIDSRDMPPQSAELVSAFSKMADAKIMHPTGRAAILVSRILSKLQTERIVHSPLVQAFADEDEARTWLAEPI